MKLTVNDFTQTINLSIPDITINSEDALTLVLALLLGCQGKKLADLDEAIKASGDSEQ
jgi:hypothetical protein